MPAPHKSTFKIADHHDCGGDDARPAASPVIRTSSFRTRYPAHRLALRFRYRERTERGRPSHFGEGRSPARLPRLVVATPAAKKTSFAASGQWNSSVGVELSARHAENLCCNFRRVKWVLVEVLCCGSWAFRFPLFCCWRCFGITDLVVMPRCFAVPLHRRTSWTRRKRARPLALPKMPWEASRIQ